MFFKGTSAKELIRAIKTIGEGNPYYSGKASVVFIEALMKQDNSKDTTLTEREIEVMNCIAEGNTNKEAGEKLFISSRTVETHRKNIMKKLGFKNSSEMIIYSIKKNMFE